MNGVNEATTRKKWIDEKLKKSGWENIIPQNPANYKITLLIATILVSFIVYQSLFLRWIGYEKVPSLGIMDEFDYVWQGLSLRQTGLPVAWTILDNVYKKNDYQGGSLKNLGVEVNNKILKIEDFKNNPKPIIAIGEFDYGFGIKQILFASPFLDHPPLGGLIQSLFISNQVTKFSDLNSSEFRKSSLMIAIFTVTLLYIFILLITKQPWLAVLTVAIYSTVPTYILASRFALLENVMVPLVILHLILLYTSIFQLNKTKKITFVMLFLSGVVGGLSVLVKESALGFLLGSVALILIQKLSKKYIITLIIGSTLPIAIYVLWSLWLQPQLFLNLLLANSNRSFFGSLSFVTMIPSLRFANFPLDGWWIWGLLSVVYISYLNIKQYYWLTMPFIFHFLFVMFLGGPNYPWYYLALLPFIAATSALSIWEMVKNVNIPMLISFFIVAVSSSLYWGYSVFHMPPNLQVFRLLLVSFLIIIFIRKKLVNNKLVIFGWYAFFIIFLYQLTKWNIQSTLYIIDHWGNLPIGSLPTL